MFIIKAFPIHNRDKWDAMSSLKTSYLLLLQPVHQEVLSRGAKSRYFQHLHGENRTTSVMMSKFCTTII
jgi:hypothetical protein